MSRQCTAQRRDGEQCTYKAIKGAAVCRRHGGNAPQVRAAAAVRAELEHWGLRDSTVDPGEVLLRLVTQSAARAERYAAELERMVDEHGGLQQAMVGDNLILHPESGSLTKVGEYVRGIASLEAAERDRCARFAAKAVDAGVQERQVQLAEQQGDLMERVISAALDDIGMSAEQRQHAVSRMAHHLRRIDSPS